jgi:hypothetical protein
MFTTDELAINPYITNKILIFRNTTNDSIIFSKVSRSREKGTVYMYDSERARIDNDNCQGDYFISEKDFTFMRGSDTNAYISINLGFLYSFTNPTFDKYMFFEMYFPDEGVMNFTAFFRFTADTIYNYPFDNQNYEDSVVTLHSQISIGPKYFQNVYELYCNNSPDPRYNDWISIVYYSIKEGVVGCRTNLGKIWYLADI